MTAKNCKAELVIEENSGNVEKINISPERREEMLN